MKKKPPPPPPKKSRPAAKKAPQAKRAAKKNPKVVPITKGKPKGKADAKPKPKRRVFNRMLFERELPGRGPQLFTRATPFDDLIPDPRMVLAERKKRGGYKRPPPELINSLRVHIRGGVPVPQALGNYGVTFGEFRDWQKTAQHDHEQGIESEFVDFMIMLEVLEAQGETLATIDARTQRENVLPMMRVRYARNWDGKMSGANDGRYIKDAEPTESVEDDDAAYLLSIIQSAHGGHKPEDEAAEPAGPK